VKLYSLEGKECVRFLEKVERFDIHIGGKLSLTTRVKLCVIHRLV
jgi:hypothetical protein